MEVCIPFYLDVDCLRACLDSVKRFIDPERVLVNNADPAIDITDVLEKSGLSCMITVVPGEIYGPDPSAVATKYRATARKTDHCGCLDYLFSKTESEVVLVLDQDCLLTRPITPLLKRIEEGTVLLGPLDLFCVMGEQVKGQKIYNYVPRLTPLPGYIHASFMLMNAKMIKEKIGVTPFRYPTNVKPFGYGLLGAEPYYGATYSCRREGLPIEFMFMLPGCYGICAELAYDNKVYAVHLWYSSRTDVMNPEESYDYFWEEGTEKSNGHYVTGLVNVGWLQTEKKRFLQDYWSHNLKIKWGLL